MCDGSGQPDGEMVDRSGQLDECNSSKAQIRTLLEEQRQTILADCNARVSHHELQAAQAEEERRLLQGQLWRQKLEFREARQQSLTEMEEIRKKSDFCLPYYCEKKTHRGSEHYFGIIRHCINDSKDFQDAESVRSGNSHVTSRPVSFPPHPIPGGMLRHSFVEPQRRAAKHLGHTWKIGRRFCKSRCVFISTLSPRIASMEFVNRRAAPFDRSGEK